MSELEDKILQGAIKGIDSAITGELVGYGKPLSKLVNRVVEANEDALFELINNEFSTLIGDDVFKQELAIALNQKLARVLIAKMGGELEKRVNELKQDPTTRAKITIALTSAIDSVIQT